MFDYHLHSTFSADSNMTMTEICQKAIELGLDEIVFTDHFGFDPNDIDYDFLHYTDYVESFKKAKAHFGHDLNLLLGIEIGIQPYFSVEFNDFLKNKFFDFIIGSIHMVNRYDLTKEAFFIGKNKKQAYQAYLEEVLESILACENFDVLGHLDLIRRYGPYHDRILHYDDHREIIESILKTLIQTGRGLEINTSGLRYGIDTPHPTFDIIQAYRKLGGEILTLGSDAHTPSHIATGFNEALEMIREAGFTHLTRFKDRKPYFYPLEKG